MFHLPLADIGSHLVGSDGRLHVVDVVGVEPKTGGDQIRGAVAVSRLVDTAALEAACAGCRYALRVDVPGGGGIVLGRAPADARTEELPLYADAARGAKLVALLRSGSLPSLATRAAAGVLLLALAWAAVLGAAAPAVAQRVEPPLPDLATEVHIDLRDRR